MKSKKNTNKPNSSKRGNTARRGEPRTSNKRVARAGGGPGRPAEDFIFGRNPVTEALKGSRTVEKILIQDGAAEKAGRIIALAKEQGIIIQKTSKTSLDNLSNGAVHQGIAAKVSSYKYWELDEIIETVKGKEAALVVLMDEIEDPHNLGAIMRSAECFGADGVVITKHRSAGLTETVAKTSAGAIEHLPCAKVTNMPDAIETLQAAGFWVWAADMDGQNIKEMDCTGKIAIVIGNEGRGVSRLVRERCDFIVSIPMGGRVGSLNASNAAAIMLYEISSGR